MVPPCCFGGALETVLTAKVVPLPRLTPGRVFASRVNVFLLLLISLALADAPATVEAPAPSDDSLMDSALPEETPPPPAMTQRDRLEEAVALRRIGAFEDAARMLEKAREMGGGVNEQVAYQSGVLAEVRENWRGAISAYEAVAAGWPQSATAHDARFRRAYCLEELGEHRAATKAVKRLQREGRWSEDDERTMALQRGITELRSGKTRRGIKRILKALESGEDERTWIRAKARLALVRAQLGKAASIRLKGDKRAAKRLKKRSALLSASEKQAIVMFNLGEPEFALEGLLLLGDGYMELYEAMLSYPPPRSVDDPETYREVVMEKASILLTKAHARYDEGVRVAARTQWVGSVTERLRAKRDALVSQLPQPSSD